MTMDSVPELVDALASPKNTVACRAMQSLCTLAEQDGGLYAYFDVFAAMLESENSLVRNRGLLLIAACARWDTENRIDALLEQYLTHIWDEKPITARQCIQSLPELARWKPALAPAIREALLSPPQVRYAPSMAPLVAKDIAKALRAIPAPDANS